MYVKSALYSLKTMMQILEHLIMLCAVREMLLKASQLK